MSGKIDRLHEEAVESVEGQWDRVTKLAISEAQTALSVDGRRAVKSAAHEMQRGEVEGCPSRFKGWWETFRDHFRRARAELILPKEVPEPPEERGEWESAVQKAEAGEGFPVVVLAFARGVRQKRR